MTEEKKKYEGKVIFLHKSKKGKHLYAFNNDDALANAESILMSVSDVKALIAEQFDSVRITIMEKKLDASKTEKR